MKTKTLARFFAASILAVFLLATITVSQAFASSPPPPGKCGPTGTYASQIGDNTTSVSGYTIEATLYALYYCQGGTYAGQMYSHVQLWQGPYVIGGTLVAAVDDGTNNGPDNITYPGDAGSGSAYTSLDSPIWYTNCGDAFGRIYPGGNGSPIDATTNTICG